MKENTKYVLKRINRILQIGVVTFAWIMACIGVSAYAVYWLRQSANYENEEVKRTPNRRINNANDITSFYQVKSVDFLDTRLASQSNTNSYRSYFTFDNPQGSNYNTSFSFVFDGDFTLKVMGTTLSYNVMQFDFVYNGQQDLERYDLTLAGIYLIGDNTQGVYVRSSQGSYRYDNVIIFSHFVPQGSIYITENYEGSLIDFYFNELFNTSSSFSTRFEFKKEYNFNALCSDNITGDSNVIQPYKMAYRDDPSDSLIYFYIPFDFVSNNYLYKGIWLEFEKPIYVRINGEDKQVNFPSSTSQLMVKNVYYMRSLPATNTPDILPSSSTMDLVASRYRYGQKQWNNGVSDVYAFVYGTNYEFINDAYRLIYISNNSYNGYYSYYARPLPSNTDVANSGGLWNPYLYRGLTLLQVLNNGYLTYELGTLTYSTNDIGLDNVFNLFSSAFTGLIPILAIQVIPGISIGLLLFVPVIVTLIIVIFKLVKK